MFVLYLLHGVKGKLDPGQDRMGILEAVQRRDDNAEIKYLSFMFESYQPKYWWFEVEVAEVYRRISLTGGLRLLAGGGGVQYAVG